MRILFGDALATSLFWLSTLLILYTYLGYPVWLFFRRSQKAVPVIRLPFQPFVSIIIAVRNEEDNLPRKLSNLAAVNYPREKLQIVVVSDGSTDRTNELLLNSPISVHSILLADSSGKASALNHAVKEAYGEVLVFMDARQTVSRESINALVQNFSDSSVGCVSGEVIIAEKQRSGVGAYWGLEKQIRRLESETGSAVQASGALYAIRRELVESIPKGLLADDMYIPLMAVRSGKRIVLERSVIAYDRPEDTDQEEFWRKVRTLTGNYQLVRLAPWLLTFKNPILFEFVSHKMLRLFMPIFLAVLFITTAVVRSGIYGFALYLQILFYCLAALGLYHKNKITSVAHTFVLLNAAASLALLNFVTGRQPVWRR